MHSPSRRIRQTKSKARKVDLNHFIKNNSVAAAADDDGGGDEDQVEQIP